MNAKQARELTEKNLRGPVIRPMLDHVHNKIREAAEKGFEQIAHPLWGYKGTYGDHRSQDALWEALRAEGYEVQHHPDPDPGHPCSGAYTTVSW